MKKLFFTVIAAMLIVSGCNKSNQFKVTLNLDNADTQTVYLTKTVNGQVVVLDSATFAGKTVVLTAPNDEPQRAYSLKFASSNEYCNANKDCGDFVFFTENQNTTISGTFDDLGHWTVKGCPVMDEWTTYRETFLPMEDQMMALFNEANDVAMAGDTVRGTELMAQLFAMMDDYNNQHLEYYKNHGDSYLTHFMVDHEKEQMDLEELREIASSFTTESMYSKSINDYIETFGRMESGLQEIPGERP